jgi:hypothetical protein
VSRRFLGLCAVAAGAVAVGAYAAKAPATTAPPPVVDIRVRVTDKAIVMSPRSAYRGSYARFTLVNTGRQKHTILFGRTQKQSGVQTGFNAALRPEQQKILLLFLDYRGGVPYYGTLPADRKKPGMKGTFTIK